MNKLSKNTIRRLIIQEISRMVGEDAIIAPSGKDSYRDTGFSYNTHSDDSTCKRCGSNQFFEEECMECGYIGGQMLEEGCGCGTCDGCSDESDGSDYSLDSMDMIKNMLGSFSHSHDDHSHEHKHEKHNNEYMAKPSLYKVAKYAQKLLHMIPDGYELDDWQRTKIAQIADDISEVYHSLDYDFHDDEF